MTTHSIDIKTIDYTGVIRVIMKKLMISVVILCAYLPIFVWLTCMLKPQHAGLVAKASAQ